MKLKEIGEYGAHRWIEENIGKHCKDINNVGMSDDCAIIELGGENSLLLKTDRVATNAKGSYAGKLCVIQNYSDILSSGGKPIGILLALSLPHNAEFEYFTSIMQGASNEALKYNAPIVGGDLKETDYESIVGTAIGIVNKGSHITRTGAKNGDIVAVTSKRGRKYGSRWAYTVDRYFNLNIPQDIKDELKRRESGYLEIPYNEMMEINHLKAANAGMDMSDGLPYSLKLLAEKSRCKISVDYDKIEAIVDPIVDPLCKELGLKRINFALTPGYDWENLLTIKKDMFNDARNAVRKVGGDLFDIGKIEEGSDVFINNGQKSLLLNGSISGEKFQKSEWKDKPKLWLETRCFDGS